MLDIEYLHASELEKACIYKYIYMHMSIYVWEWN